jgi:hypothetical protein
MLKLLFVAALALLAAPANAAERSFTVTDFDKVQVDGAFDVTLVTGRAPRAVASGDADALNALDVEVQGRLLKIRRNLSAWGGYPGARTGAVTIALATHDLRNASVRGAGRLAIDRVEAMRFEVSLFGGGKIEIGDVSADRFDLGLVGSGKIKLAGRVKSFRGTVEGAADLEAGALIADDAQVNAGSAGTVTLSVRRAATVNATGAGDVEILGTPACKVTTRGFGQVVCGKGQ